MNFLPALHFFCLLIYLSMAGFILYRDPKSTLNRTCSALLFCFGLWTLSDIFSHNPGIANDSVMLIENISSIGWLVFPVALLCFALAFSRRERVMRTKTFLVLAPILPLVLLYQQWTSHLTLDYVQRSYGWEFQWSDSCWPYVFYVYYVSLTLISIYLVYRRGKDTEKPQEKKQARMIVVCVGISLVLGSATDVVVPVFGIKGVPSLADVSVLILAVGIVYAIIKYEFLTISPAIAAENIIRSMEEILVLLDDEGNITTANKSALRLLGYRQEELRGKSIAMLMRKAGSSSSLLEGETAGGSTGVYEGRFQAKNGKAIPVIFSISVLKDQGGNTAGTVIVATDLTKHKLAEEEKNKLRTQLLQAEKLAAIGQLAADVAHEINNPLAYVRANLTALEDYSATIKDLWLAAKAAATCLQGTGQPEADDLAQNLLTARGRSEESVERNVLEIAELTDEILEGVKRIADLVSGFNSLTKPLEPAQAESFDAGDLVQKILSSLPETSDQRERKIALEVDGRLQARAAVEDVRTALLNVLTFLFARRESPSCPVRPVSIRCYARADRPTVDIIDPMLKMTEDERLRIFEPRVQVDERKGRTMRLDLGMPLAYQFLQRNGGNLFVEQAEDGGTVFRFDLSPERG